MPVLKVTDTRWFQDDITLKNFLTGPMHLSEEAVKKLLKRKKPLLVETRFLKTEYEVSDDVKS